MYSEKTIAEIQSTKVVLNGRNIATILVIRIPIKAINSTPPNLENRLGKQKPASPNR